MRVRNYELMFVISPLFADDESVANVIERISHAVEHEGGEIQSINHNPPWGRRRLAYPIRAYASGEAGRRNFTEGFYVLMHFALEASKVTSVDRTLRLTDPILRHLLTIITDGTVVSSSDDDDDLPDEPLRDTDSDDEDEIAGDDDDGDDDDDDEDDDDGDDDDDDDGEQTDNRNA